MRKYVPLMIVAALSLTAASAFAVSPVTSEPNYVAHKSFRMWVDINTTNQFQVNFYNAGLTLIGNADSTTAQSGGWSSFKSQNFNAGDVQMVQDDGTRTHLGVYIQSNLPAWSISMATDNVSFLGNSYGANRGGLILAGATTGDNNRIPILWKNYATLAAAGPDTMGSDKTNWVYVNDLSDSTWPGDRLGYSRMAYGWGSGANAKFRVNNVSTDADIIASQFYTNIGGNISNNNGGAYSGWVNVVLYSK